MTIRPLMSDEIGVVLAHMFELDPDKVFRGKLVFEAGEPAVFEVEMIVPRELAPRITEVLIAYELWPKGLRDDVTGP